MADGIVAAVSAGHVFRGAYSIGLGDTGFAVLPSDGVGAVCDAVENRESGRFSAAGECEGTGDEEGFENDETGIVAVVEACCSCGDKDEMIPEEGDCACVGDEGVCGG